MFSVVTINTDRSLLTIEELRAAVGITGSGSDTQLTQIGAFMSAAITKACRVVADGVTPPTLRLEAVSDLYRLQNHQASLVLSRRFVTLLSSVVENGVTLAATDYELDKSAGLLRRLNGDDFSCWPCGKITVSYSAGFQTVPDDLKLAATKFVQLLYQSGERDPLLKRQNIPGVLENEWWVEPTREAGVPPEVQNMLEIGDYVNVHV